MIDPQDPLPESDFFWRRVFSYVLAVALIVLLALVVYQTHDPVSLREIAGQLCILLFVVTTYYMIAPSAEHVIKTIQTVRLFNSPNCPEHLKASVAPPPSPEPVEAYDAAPRGRP